MDHKKTLISAGIFAVLGTSICLIGGIANASLIADGSYIMTINETPFSTDAYGNVAYVSIPRQSRGL